MTNPQPNYPLHGVTLKMILEYLVEQYGWDEYSDMLLSSPNQEAIFSFALYLILGTGILLLWYFGGPRLYKHKGLISALLFSAGVLIGFIIPIDEITNWIFFLGRRSRLPISQLMIGLGLIIVSFLLPTKRKQADDGEEDE